MPLVEAPPYLYQQLEAHFDQEGRVRREIFYGRDIAEAASSLIDNLNCEASIRRADSPSDQSEFTICSARVIGKRISPQRYKGPNFGKMVEVWEFEFIVFS